VYGVRRKTERLILSVTGDRTLTVNDAARCSSRPRRRTGRQAYSQATSSATESLAPASFISESTQAPYVT